MPVYSIMGQTRSVRPYKPKTRFIYSFIFQVLNEPDHTNFNNNNCSLTVSGVQWSAIQVQIIKCRNDNEGMMWNSCSRAKTVWYNLRYLVSLFFFHHSLFIYMWTNYSLKNNWLADYFICFHSNTYSFYPTFIQTEFLFYFYGIFNSKSPFLKIQTDFH